jgi:hypothetical protein
MQNMPRRGDTVFVWPTHSKVQNGAESWGRWMPLEGRLLNLDAKNFRYWHQRLLDRDVVLEDPRPAAKAADSTKPSAEVVTVPAKATKGDR